MDARAVRDFATSMMWNVDTRHFISCVVAGIDVSDRTPVKDGWTRVSRHAAGKESAWVKAHKIRQAHPMLKTRVIGTPEQEWKAEVWVRVETTA